MRERRTQNQNSSRTQNARPSNAQSTRQSALRISRRVVNSKRHTTGYMIGGEFRTVSQARSLADSGRIAGVRVVGNHIQAVPGARRLSDLPTTVQ